MPHDAAQPHEYRTESDADRTAERAVGAVGPGEHRLPISLQITSVLVTLVGLNGALNIIWSLFQGWLWLDFSVILLGVGPKLRKLDNRARHFMVAITTLAVMVFLIFLVVFVLADSPIYVVWAMLPSAMVVDASAPGCYVPKWTVVPAIAMVAATIGFVFRSLLRPETVALFRLDDERKRAVSRRWSPWALVGSLGMVAALKVTTLPMWMFAETVRHWKAETAMRVLSSGGGDHCYWAEGTEHWKADGFVVDDPWATPTYHLEIAAKLDGDLIAKTDFVVECTYAMDEELPDRYPLRSISITAAGPEESSMYALRLSLNAREPDRLQFHIFAVCTRNDLTGHHVCWPEDDDEESPERFNWSASIARLDAPALRFTLAPRLRERTFLNFEDVRAMGLGEFVGGMRYAEEDAPPIEQPVDWEVHLRTASGNQLPVELVIPAGMTEPASTPAHRRMANR